MSAIKTMSAGGNTAGAAARDARRGESASSSLVSTVVLVAKLVWNKSFSAPRASVSSSSNSSPSTQSSSPHQELVAPTLSVQHASKSEEVGCDSAFMGAAAVGDFTAPAAAQAETNATPAVSHTIQTASTGDDHARAPESSSSSNSEAKSCTLQKDLVSCCACARYLPDPMTPLPLCGGALPSSVVTVDEATLRAVCTRSIHSLKGGPCPFILLFGAGGCNLGTACPCEHEPCPYGAQCQNMHTTCNRIHGRGGVTTPVPAASPSPPAAAKKQQQQQQQPVVAPAAAASTSSSLAALPFGPSLLEKKVGRGKPVPLISKSACSQLGICRAFCHSSCSSASCSLLHRVVSHAQLEQLWAQHKGDKAAIQAALGSASTPTTTRTATPVNANISSNPPPAASTPATPDTKTILAHARSKSYCLDYCLNKCTRKPCKFDHVSQQQVAAEIAASSSNNTGFGNGRFGNSGRGRGRGGGGGLGGGVGRGGRPALQPNDPASKNQLRKIGACFAHAAGACANASTCTWTHTRPTHGEVLQLMADAKQQGARLRDFVKRRAQQSPAGAASVVSSPLQQQQPPPPPPQPPASPAAPVARPQSTPKQPPLGTAWVKVPAKPPAPKLAASHSAPELAHLQRDTTNFDIAANNCFAATAVEAIAAVPQLLHLLGVSKQAEKDNPAAVVQAAVAAMMSALSRASGPAAEAAMTICQTLQQCREGKRSTGPRVTMEFEPHEIDALRNAAKAADGKRPLEQGKVLPSTWRRGLERVLPDVLSLGEGA